MAVTIWLRRVNRSWPDILRDAPPGLVHPRGASWVVARAPEATTGIQLGESGGDLFFRLPLFIGASELAQAATLVPMALAASGGELEVSAQPVPSALWPHALARIAAKLSDAALAEIPGLLASPGTCFQVEGWQRPYYLGQVTLNHLLRIVAPAELLERLRLVIAALQAYPADSVATVESIEREGRRVSHATWDPASERLIPPCDELTIRHRDVVWRVGHARLPEVIPPHGTRLDDYHWLALPPASHDLAALMARAEAAAIKL